MMDAAFARRFLFKVKFDIPTSLERMKYLANHLGDFITTDIQRRFAENYELSFGELRNAIVQLRTYPTVDADLIESILEAQLEGRAGIITRTLGF
jgi:hypothetical protein